MCYRRYTNAVSSLFESIGSGGLCGRRGSYQAGRVNTPWPGRKNRIALAAALAHNPPMLARVLSAVVNWGKVFPVEVEVN